MVLGALAVVLMSGAAFAQRPAEGVGTIHGVIAGRHGGRVRYVWRHAPQIIERGNGWARTALEQLHVVKLTRAGTFSFSVPGCPALFRAEGCAGTTYESWATYNGVRCSEIAFVVNVTTGEAANIEYLNVEHHPELRNEPLVCHAVGRFAYVPPRCQPNEGKIPAGCAGAEVEGIEQERAAQRHH
jgi:hypothetical protein